LDGGMLGNAKIYHDPNPVHYGIRIYKEVDKESAGREMVTQNVCVCECVRV